MDDYLDYDLGIVDTFVDGGGFPAVEPLIWGDVASEMNSVLESNNYDGFDFSGGESGNYSTDTRSNDQIAADIGLGSGEPGLLKAAEAWLKQNPNLAKLGLSGVAGLAGAYSANKAGQNSIESLKEQEAQKLRTRQRVADSIIGMAPFQVSGASPLQRLDGSRVFGQDGKIVR